jgi:hypothetical protein
LGIGGHDPNGPLSVQKEVPHASIAICVAFHVFFFCKFLASTVEVG